MFNLRQLWFLCLYNLPRLELALTMSLPYRFSFAQFDQQAPINASTIWTYVLERNAERIGVKRAKPARENLEKLVLATFRLANEVGFRAMSLRDLCRETGLSMGGVYGYIDGKDQLAEMIEDVVRHAIGEVPRWFASIDDPRQRLEAIVRSWIYLSESLQPWFYFVYMDSRVLAARQRKMAKQSELSAQQCIAGLLDEVAPSPGNALLAAHCLALMQDWYVKRWKYRAAKVDVDTYADSTVAMVCR